MERGTMPFFAAMGALVLVAGLFLSFYMSSHVYTTEGTKIILPEDTDNNSVVVSGNITAEKPDYKAFAPQVNLENVQKIVETLKRPEAYSATIKNTIFWNGGSQTLSLHQYIKNGYCKTEASSQTSSQVRHTILSSDSFYAWKTGDASYYRGKKGEFSFDTIGMVPTYETVLTIKKEDIFDAGVKNIDYVPCVFVTAKGTEKDTRYTYWISTVTGLLVRADYYKGDKLIRQVAASEVSLEAPSDSFFILPNNSLVFSQ